MSAVGAVAERAGEPLVALLIAGITNGVVSVPARGQASTGSPRAAVAADPATLRRGLA